MEYCYNPDVPTKIVNKRSVYCAIFLIIFWSIGFIIPFIAVPISYLRMSKMERLTFPENQKFKLDMHLKSSEIYDYLEKYTAFYKHKMKMFTLSQQTFEGRNIHVVHIKTPSYYNNVFKGRILVLAGMSGCIWDSVMSSIDLIHKLCQECQYKSPYTLDYEWYIIPIFNPDGYDYTLSIRNTERKDVINDPKNRFKPDRATTTCRGIALDRNFGFHWGESKARDYNSICWVGFADKHPFSQNETIAMNDFIAKQYDVKKEPITMYLQLHGNYARDDLTYPWRYTKRKPFNYRTLGRMAATAVKAVNNETGYHFTYAQSGERDCSGVMTDWLMGVRHVAYVFTIEPWYKVSNDSDLADPQIYLEKAIQLVFSLVKSLRHIQMEHQEQEYFN